MTWSSVPDRGFPYPSGTCRGTCIPVPGAHEMLLTPEEPSGPLHGFKMVPRVIGWTSVSKGEADQTPAGHSGKD